MDLWLKDLAPSTELRKWFGHDPARWQEFGERYAAEVRQHHEAYDQLRELARKGPVTLVYSAHDEIHNDAVVLRGLLSGVEDNGLSPCATRSRQHHRRRTVRRMLCLNACSATHSSISSAARIPPTA